MPESPVVTITSRILLVRIGANGVAIIANSHCMIFLLFESEVANSNQLNHALVQEVWDRVTGLYWGMETPGLTITLNVVEIIRYLITVLCLLCGLAVKSRDLAIFIGPSVIVWIVLCMVAPRPIGVTIACIVGWFFASLVFTPARWFNRRCEFDERV